VTYAVNVSTTLADGTTVSGGATIVVESSTGTTTISDATITLGPAAMDTMGIVLEDVVVDASAAGDFKPRSGVARYDLTNETNDGMDAIRLEFVEDTPVDGSLEISINSADAILFAP